MPTRKRRLREAARNAERTRVEKMLANIPDYLKKARDQDTGPTQMLRSLAELEAPEKYFNLRGGLVRSDPTGDLLPNTAAIRKGSEIANSKRAAKREQYALALKQKYSKIWGRKGLAVHISRKEGCSRRTVEKYFKDFP